MNSELLEYKRLEQALSSGLKVELCSINADYAPVVWSEVDEISINFHPNRYRITDHTTMESVQHLTNLCFTASEKAGWWNDIDKTDVREKGLRLLLIHSEISETMEGIRKNCRDDHLPHRRMEEVELADALIRICDYAGAMNLDLAGALVEKMTYNKNRVDHKKENRDKANGKKF